MNVSLSHRRTSLEYRSRSSPKPSLFHPPVTSGAAGGKVVRLGCFRRVLFLKLGSCQTSWHGASRRNQIGEPQKSPNWTAKTMGVYSNSPGIDGISEPQPWFVIGRGETLVTAIKVASPPHRDCLARGEPFGRSWPKRELGRPVRRPSRPRIRYVQPAPHAVGRSRCPITE